MAGGGRAAALASRPVGGRCVKDLGNQKMRIYALPCLLSALAGGLLTTWLSSPGSIAPAAAQERAPGPLVGRREVALPPPTAVATAPDPQLTPEERVNVAVYESVNRSVVNINTKSVRTDAFSLFEIPSEGAGSGSVLDTQGHILTNYHVIEGAREIQVTLHDAKSYEARLVGKDETNDVAVLQIEAPAGALIPVVLGDSRNLKVGQRVFAIGNPFGLERTLTTGIISSLNRSLPARNNRTIKSIIQIDAAINPGNSGGPLLDTHGRLIGMNTAIASSTGQSAGVGFAVAVANIARVVPQLIERGRIIRPDAGITRVMQTEAGLVIATMAPDGPAQRAALRGFRLVKQKHKQGIFSYETQTIDRNAADLIVAVDGEKVKTADDFLAAIEVHHPGDDVTLTVVRDGREVLVPLRLTAAE
jgi:S1-C subfamily serine protease